MDFASFLGCLISAAIATVVGVAVYLASYRILSRKADGDLKDASGSLFRVIGMLVSLMLSLAFADVVAEMAATRGAIEREVVALTGAYEDLRRFSGDDTAEIRVLLVDYARAVIEDDWPALADDRLGEKAGALLREISDRVFELESSTPVQEQLWSRLLARIDAVADHRLVRLDNARAKPPGFLYVVVLGFLITMVCFGAYRPQPPLVTLLALFSAFFGLVFYLVLTLADPFQGTIGVEPDRFEDVVEVMERREGET